MTKEEAVKLLTVEIGLRSSGYYDHLAHGGKQDKAEENYLDALDMAISALREQEERSKGCEYCSDSERDLYYHDGACHAMNDLVYVAGNSIVCDFGCKAYASFEIKFCPMCGRRLEEV